MTDSTISNNRETPSKCNRYFVKHEHKMYLNADIIQTQIYEDSAYIVALDSTIILLWPN